jgi:hypothetical protein
MLNKIKQIKYNRMKPVEKWVYYIFTDLEEYYHPNYPDNKYYKHKGILLFNHNENSGHFWCHYRNFWFVLEWKFSLSTDEIRILLKRMIVEYVIKKEVKSVNHGNLNDIEYKNLIKKELIVENVTGYGTDWKDEKLIKKELIPIRDLQGILLTAESDLIKKDLIVESVTDFRDKKELIKK